MTASDQRLIERLRHGEVDAFDAFFNEYYPKLFRFARRRVNDEHLAEDIAQATMCRALQSLHTFRGEAALLTWLCTLCRRETSTRFREQRSQQNALALREDDPEVRAALESLLCAERDDPLAATGLREVQEAVLTTLDYLPSPYAEILEWKYVHDLSVNEIAQNLGRSIKATESLLTRARSAFRDAFAVLHSDLQPSASTSLR